MMLKGVGTTLQLIKAISNTFYYVFSSFILKQQDWQIIYVSTSLKLIRTNSKNDVIYDALDI